MTKLSRWQAVDELHDDILQPAGGEAIHQMNNVNALIQALIQALVRAFIQVIIHGQAQAG
jgi:hypothetical protein